MIDMDLLLRGCGFVRHEERECALYAHDGWNQLFTFRLDQTHVSQRRLEQVILYLRFHLGREGKL